MACVWLVSPFLLRTFPVATPKLPRSYPVPTTNLLLPLRLTFPNLERTLKQP